MPPSPVTVTRSGPGLAQLRADLERIRSSEVLVGIPAEKAPREGSEINNASLLFILGKGVRLKKKHPTGTAAQDLYVYSHGSPLMRIPPRPVLEPSVEQNKDIIVPHLEAASKAILDHKPQDAERELKLAGTVAANAAKRYVRQGNNLAPNAPSTIRRKGSSRPLIASGAMIRAIVSVVRQTK